MLKLSTKQKMTPSLIEPKFHEKSLIKTLLVDVNVSLIKAIFFLTDPMSKAPYRKTLGSSYRI